MVVHFDFVVIALLIVQGSALVSLRGNSTAVVPADTGAMPPPTPRDDGWKLNVLQWNPHYECFDGKHPDCDSNAKRTMTETLVGKNIDFATAAMWEPRSYSPPARYAFAKSTCGLDVTVMFWNAERWTETSEVPGCMEEHDGQHDRAFLLKTFTSNSPEISPTQEIIMISAHYPHPGDVFPDSLLKKSVQKLLVAKPHAGVVFAADTNIGWFQGKVQSTATILGHLLDSTEGILGSVPVDSCCLVDGFRNKYDRVAVNFATTMVNDKMLLDPVPSWANFDGGKFHKPIWGEFEVLPDPCELCV